MRRTDGKPLRVSRCESRRPMARTAALSNRTQPFLGVDDHHARQQSDSFLMPGCCGPPGGEGYGGGRAGGRGRGRSRGGGRRGKNR
jgi:hypothetical protein